MGAPNFMKLFYALVSSVHEHIYSIRKVYVMTIATGDKIDQQQDVQESLDMFGVLQLLFQHFIRISVIWNCFAFSAIWIVTGRRSPICRSKDFA